MIIHKNQVFDMHQACNYNVSVMAEQGASEIVLTFFVLGGREVQWEANFQKYVDTVSE